MRIHLVGMPHLDTVRAVEWCAFSQKTRKLCDMLSGLGHEVYYYGGPENEAAVKQHVVVVSEDDRRRWWPDVAWRENVFNAFDPMSAPWMTLNSRAVQGIAERLEPTDLIGLTMGASQAAVQQAFPNHVVAEVGIGYEGILSNTHHCFESEAWRHYLWGRHGVADGHYYDVVIPNAFDPDDYLLSKDPGQYLLYLGRMTERKGLAVVQELAKRFPVITAGQGEKLDGIEHRGVVTGKEKAELLAGAAALICATRYIEPFGGVAVEAMMSGVPVITTPWGAFSETVQDNLPGRKCHTLAEFVEAAHLYMNGWRALPGDIRQYAIDRYSLTAVAPQYDRWLTRLSGLYAHGWYG